MDKRHSLGHATPRVHSKQIIINRRSHVGPSGGLSAGMSMGHMGGGQRASLGMSSAVAGDIAHKGVGDMKHKREGEKKDMQNLNDRLANYISQVRSLEAENKALREQLKKKRKDFDPEPMKDIYQTEIDETKKLLDLANKDNAELKVSLTSLQDELEDQRALCQHHETRIEQLEDKVSSLNDENSHRTAECDMLRRKVEELEKQVAHWKAKYKEVYTQLQATRNDLKDETNQRIAECSRAETLQEELDFLKTITDAEIKEYKAMLSKEDETGSNVREAWNDELSKHMKELRDEYEQRLGDISEEMSSRYESQIHQIRQSIPKADQAGMAHSKSESSKMRAESSQKDLRIKELEGQLDRMKLEIRNLTSQCESTHEELLQEKDLRASEVSKLHLEMETMIRELQMLMDAKMTLELEIAAYRKLLEGEESRLSVGHVSEVVGGYRSEMADNLSNIIENSGKGDAKGGDSASTSMSTGRITMQRTSKSVLSIAEVDSNGRYVTLENTSPRRQKTTVALKGWKLNRVFAGTSFMPEVNLDYVFNEEVVIDAEQSIKLWAKKFEKEADVKKGDVVSTVEDWGQVNRNSVLTLYDEKEAVKATLTIKVVF